MISNKVVNVLIADSQFLVVEALESIIGKNERYSLSGVATNQNDLLRLFENISDGLLIIDITNIDCGGIDGLKVIREKYPQIAVLILTNSLTKAEFAGLAKLSIKNIIYKTADGDEIFSAIEASLKGKKYYSDEIMDLFLDFSETKYLTEVEKHLTTSELEIVKLIAAGLTTKEIAARKNISYHTVNTHRKNIFKKVEVSNASELIMHAIKAGWIDNIEYYI
jgi:DNA-binding NarL/FixJ family response regulator